MQDGEIAQYGRSESKNMEIALETLTKGGIGLNAATRAYPFRRDT
jgi:hypothetical protein